MPMHFAGPGRDGRGQRAASLVGRCSNQSAWEAGTEEGVHPGLRPQEQWGSGTTWLAELHTNGDSTNEVPALSLSS